MAGLQTHRWGYLDISVLSMIIIGWGANFLAIRYAVLDIPNWTALTLRLALVSLLLAPFIRLPVSSWKSLLFLAAILVPGHFGMLFYASQLTESVSAVSLVIQLNPAFSMLFAWLLLRERPGRQRIMGLLLAMLAMLILFYEPGLLNSASAMLVAGISALFLGVYSVLLRRLNAAVRPVDIIGWTAIFGTPMVAVIAYTQEAEFWPGFTGISLPSYAGLLYTAVASSIVCHGAWAWLCRRHPIAQVTPFSLLVPFVTIILSVIIFAELLTLQMLIAAGVLCAGLLLIVRSRKRA